MCLNASFGQWHHCWCNPHQTLVNTHPPSSLCASTGQLSLLLVSADGLREGWGRAGRGWVGRQLSRCKSPSWVCWGQALSQPPCSRAAALAPAVPADRTKLPGHFLTVPVGGEPPWRWCSIISLYKSRWHCANTHQPLSLPQTTPDKTRLEMHSSPFDLGPPPYTQWAQWLHSTYTIAIIHLHLYGDKLLYRSTFKASAFYRLGCSASQKPRTCSLHRAAHNDSVSEILQHAAAANSQTYRTCGCLW